MFRASIYNTIQYNKDNKKIIFNTVTHMGYNYNSHVENLLKYLELSDENSTRTSKQVFIDTLLCYELLDKGILIPDENGLDEYEYLQAQTPLRLPLKGFFGAARIRTQNLPLLENPAMLFVGIPCDLGSPKPGSRFGPQLIRERSHDINFGSENGNYLYHLSDRCKISTQKKMFDLGDIIVERGGLDSWHQKVCATIETIEKHHIPICVGGDHSFTHSILRGLRKNHQNFTLVQFDHHLDVQTWGDFEIGKPKSLDKLIHSNFVSWVKQDMPDINVLQIGVNEHQHIKSQASEFEIANYFSSIGSQLSNLMINESRESMINKQLPRNKDIYISIDVDVLDCAYMPDTGYPAPIGIQTVRLISMLRYMIKHNNIIGIDIMEFGKSTDKFSQLRSSSILNIILLEIIHLLNSKI